MDYVPGQLCFQYTAPYSRQTHTAQNQRQKGPEISFKVNHVNQAQNCIENGAMQWFRIEFE